MGLLDKDNDGTIRDDAQRAADKGKSAADRAFRLHHDDPATTADVVGEGVGGAAGLATGAALGSLAGPIGTVIGAMAGAAAGWWTGRAVSEAATTFTNDDTYYRSHYDGSAQRLADRTYDDVRPAYQLGHLAGRNPEYADRNFDEVERDLQRGWTSDVSSRHGDWSNVRPYAREAYDRQRNVMSTTGYHAERMGDKVENAWDRTKAGARDLADRVEDKLDDTKDRIDGNPASRPGPDRTDDPDRRY